MNHTTVEPHRRRTTVLVGIAIVRAYQLLLSPFAGGACRFEPSCSAYSLEAIQTHGLLRGLWLSATRVARCHPLARPGFDPVPPALSVVEAPALSSAARPALSAKER